MKKIIAMAAFVLVAGASFAGEFVAEVNGVKISTTETEKKLWNFFSPVMISRMVDEELIAQKAKDLKITAPQAEIDKQYQEFTGRYADKTMLEKELARRRMTLDDVKQEIKTNLIKRELVVRTEKIGVSQEEIKKVYDQNPKMFMRPSRAKIGQIVFNKKKDAEKVLPKIKDDNFGELAVKHSIDPQAKEKDGYILNISEEDIISDLRGKIFSLKSGQVSGVIETPEKFYIIKMMDKMPSKKLEFEEVKQDISDTIMQEKINRAGEVLLVKLRREAKIKLY